MASVLFCFVCVLNCLFILTADCIACLPVCGVYHDVNVLIAFKRLVVAVSFLSNSQKYWSAYFNDLFCTLCSLCVCVMMMCV